MKILGTIFILFGIAIIALIYGPLIKEEASYFSTSMQGIRYSLDVPPQFTGVGTRVINPVNKEFGIVIPKINVNSEIFANIDPDDPDEYLPVLKQGVAHAIGSKKPDEDGNVFLFAHSSDAFYNVAQYNAVFFLLGKLQAGDEVDLFYDEDRYLYQVVETAVVTPEGLGEYVSESTRGIEKSLALQTCYPPGTTMKRLVVIAKQTQIIKPELRK